MVRLNVGSFVGKFTDVTVCEEHETKPLDAPAATVQFPLLKIWSIHCIAVCSSCIWTHSDLQGMARDPGQQSS